MHRMRFVLIAGVLAGFVPGCDGENQPNAPAQPGEVTEDFAKKSAEMMKNANTGMDPSKLRPGGAAKK